MINASTHKVVITVNPGLGCCMSLQVPKKVKSAGARMGLKSPSGMQVPQFQKTLSKPRQNELINK